MIFRNKLCLQHQQPINISLVLLLHQEHCVVPFIYASPLAPDALVDLLEVEIFSEGLVIFSIRHVDYQLHIAKIIQLQDLLH